MSNFVHLHLHSQYSLLDGAIRLHDLIPRVKELGMNSVAITDHGQMYGLVDFYKRAKAANVKPILGCETYVAGPKGRKDRTERKSYHLVLLAKNNTGYKNLKYLISMANLEGFYYNARIDKELLKGRTEGLIATSACLGGEVNRAYFKQGMDAAIATAKEYAELFEPGHYFLELQENGYRDQPVANKMLMEVAEHLKLPLVATADAHYLRREDATAHEVLMCIQQGRSLEEYRSRTEHTNQNYIKSPQEMWDHFGSIAPSALENTLKIADMVDLELDLGNHYLPHYQIPDGYSLESYLSDVSNKGLQERYGELPYNVNKTTYQERLDYELSVINKMGFAGYFLIVWDFIAFSKKQGIPVGPGRGSGAGSLVAYALRITDLDPIYNELLFERFLNPERVSMPDFDIDFCQERRGEVIDYVTDKYGHENVGQIVTFGQLSAKMVIKDVARVMKLPFKDVNAITRMIPGLVDGKKITVDQALALEPKLREMANANPINKQVIDISRALEGLNRQTGMHAAGIVIGDKKLWEYVPICKGKEGELVTQFAKDEVEEAGLVKFDFLGLKTLTLIDRAVQLSNTARKKEGLEPLDITTIKLDVSEVYDLIARGDTDGVFQLESSGFKELLRRLQPDRFEDIVAAVALYRPGPLDAGMVDDYIDRKHGRKPVVYPHQLVEEILEPTYGVIVYQEQVMRIAVALCGFTMGQADVLRKAMGKKKADVMAKMRVDFTEGAASHGGMDKNKAIELYDQIEKFAGYAFNKSHSAAYALLSYQTAYLKHFYPVQFMAALLSTEMNNIDNVVRYITTARAMNIGVLTPSVNESNRDFTVPNDEEIRFGLGAIKGVGEAAIEAIISERNENGTFHSMYEFCERVDLRKVNRKVLEALIKSGSFDCFGQFRGQLVIAVDTALEHGQRVQRDKLNGQQNLFDLLNDPEDNSYVLSNEFYAPGIKWSPKERLRFEREALGFYLSGHPMTNYQHHLATWGITPVGNLRDFQSDERLRVKIGGIVSSIREKIVRDGQARMAFLAFEDLSGSLDILIPPKVFHEYEMQLKNDDPIVIIGDMEYDSDRQSSRLIGNEIIPLEKVWKTNTRSIDLSINYDQVDDTNLNQLREILLNFHGDVPARLKITKPDHSETIMSLPDYLRIAPTDELLLKLNDLFGDQVISFNA